MDYAKKRDETDAKLKKDGASVIMSVTTGVVHNGGTGAVSAGSTLSIATYALLKDYKSNEIDGSVIQRGDLKAMTSAKALVAAGRVPEAGWMMQVSGVLYRVMHVTALAPGGVPILYWVQLRR